MQRRTFLSLVGAATLGLSSSPLILDAQAKQIKPIRKLPLSAMKRVAWTIDDGTSPESLAAYLRLASDHDLRLTFFVYSRMGSWLNCKKELKPLVSRGQIQLANHTARHPYLTRLSVAEIQNELKTAHNFLEKEFGVDARPYYRPPYGSLNQKVINAAAEVGYDKPVLWTRTLDDARKKPSLARIVSLTKSGFDDGSIVLSHANGLLVTKAFPEIMKVIKRQKLMLVTLADVFDA